MELYANTTPTHVRRFVERFCDDRPTWSIDRAGLLLGGVFVGPGDDALTAAGPFGSFEWMRGPYVGPAVDVGADVFLCLSGTLYRDPRGPDNPLAYLFRSDRLSVPLMSRNLVLGWLGVFAVSSTRCRIRTGPEEFVVNDFPEVGQLFAELENALTAAFPPPRSASTAAPLASSRIQDNGTEVSVRAANRGKAVAGKSHAAHEPLPRELEKALRDLLDDPNVTRVTDITVKRVAERLCVGPNALSHKYPGHLAQRLRKRALVLRPDLA